MFLSGKTQVSRWQKKAFIHLLPVSVGYYVIPLTVNFYLRNSMLAWVLAVVVRLLVCLCVCASMCHIVLCRIITC